MDFQVQYTAVMRKPLGRPPKSVAIWRTEFFLFFLGTFLELLGARVNYRACFLIIFGCFSVIAEAFQSAKIAWRQGLLQVIQFSA
jgi:hypothetical protein